MLFCRHEAESANAHYDPASLDIAPAEHRIHVWWEKTFELVKVKREVGRRVQHMTTHESSLKE